MKRCIKCVIPETFPGIEFDDKGECSICKDFKHKKAHVSSKDKLEEKLNNIIDQSKSKELKYDAVVAYSGGKDSTYLIHILKEKYNLKILAVTFDNGFMSDAAFANMRNVLNKLDVDHHIVKPRFGLMTDLFKKCGTNKVYPEHLTKYGSSICISCIRMVSTMALRVAIEKNIPMVMMGNSPGQLMSSENEIIYQDNKIPYILRKNLFKNIADLAGDEAYHYLMLSLEEYKVNQFPYIINVFPIIGYDEKNIYSVINELGWKKPQDVDPNSTNCKLNSVGIIKHKELYKFHPYDFEMSTLVRLGIISRDEALSRIEDPENKVNKVISSMPDFFYNSDDGVLA